MSINNKVFVSELWNQDEEGSSGISMSQVSSLVSGEISKATVGLIKADGSKAMTGNFNVAQNDLINVKSFKPPKSGDSIEVDGTFNLKNYDLDNVQNIRNVENIEAPSGQSLKIISN